MRTEISKGFNWGFLLSEQELRRVFTACKEHAEKLGGGAEPNICVKLKDGSLLEGNDLDQVLSLENAGSKAIQRISVTFEDSADPRQWQVKVEYLDGFANSENWNSARFQVVGDSRDLVFLAAAELEERVKKTRIVSWPYLTSRRWFGLAPMVLMMPLMLFFMNMLSPESSALAQLERAYKGGLLQNTTEALLFYEHAKQDARGIYPEGVLLLAMLMPIAIVFGGGYAFARLFPAYNFYIGDYIAYYDKRRSISKVIWGVLVLGVLASLIAGLLLRVF